MTADRYKVPGRPYLLKERPFCRKGIVDICGKYGVDVQGLWHLVRDHKVLLSGGLRQQLRKMVWEEQNAPPDVALSERNARDMLAVLWWLHGAARADVDRLLALPCDGRRAGLFRILNRISRWPTKPPLIKPTGKMRKG
jgi:hypothetical protein